MAQKRASALSSHVSHAWHRQRGPKSASPFHIYRPNSVNGIVVQGPKGGQFIRVLLLLLKPKEEEGAPSVAPLTQSGGLGGVGEGIR